jgi:subfamily B ATP-binding cassette protein MsbA
VISHRASTLACCQDGVVVEGGRIVDAGILSELPAYRRMAADGSLTNNWYR